MRSSHRRALSHALGDRFTLLTGGADPGALSNAARDHGFPILVVAVARLEPQLVLVRPDRHVAWSGPAAPPDPAALIDFVGGVSESDGG